MSEALQIVQEAIQAVENLIITIDENTKRHNAKLQEIEAQARANWLFQINQGAAFFAGWGAVIDSLTDDDAEVLVRFYPEVAS